MAKPRAYIETTFFQSLTSPPSRDVIALGRQFVTREWWATCRDHFDIITSQLAIARASAESFLNQWNLPHVVPTGGVLALATQLTNTGAVAETAADEATHIALATIHGCDYLVTWDFRHIANAMKRLAIAQCCQDSGHEPPVICTPAQLPAADGGWDDPIVAEVRKVRGELSAR